MMASLLFFPFEQFPLVLGFTESEFTPSTFEGPAFISPRVLLSLTTFESASSANKTHLVNSEWLKSKDRFRCLVITNEECITTTFGHSTKCVMDGKYAQSIASQYQINLIHNTFGNDKEE